MVMKTLRAHIDDWIVPVFLLLLAGLAFGLLIPWLGFYWDDWAKILVSRLYGLGGYVHYYAEDRPLSAWTHIVFTPLVGEGPLGWHILALILRWLSAWGMWWSLNGLWPRARRQNLVAAVLFLVHPVFTQQAVALTFHQQWLQYALFFFSLGAMLRAAHPAARRRRLLTALALAAMLLQLSVTEYFVPLELLRPVMLWFLLADGGVQGGSKKGRALRVAREWAPYFVILLAYTTWRLFFIRLPGEDPYRANTLFELFSSPLATLGKYARIILVDEVHILIASWHDLLNIELVNTKPFTLATYALGAAAWVAVALFFIWSDSAFSRRPTQNLAPPEQPSPMAEGAAVTNAAKVAAGDEEGTWLKQALVIGAAAVLLGPIPAWITGRQVVFDFHSNRYALPAMLGAGRLTAVLVEWLSQRRVQRAVITGFLVGCAVVFHLQVANEYRWVWTDQLRTYWQLYWRAPGLRASTALFFETEPFPNQGLFSTSAALNLLYPQERKANPAALDLYYWVYTIRPRYNHALDSVNNALSTQFRTLKFNGKTPDSLVLAKGVAGSNCLWVLNDADNDNYLVTDLTKAFLPVSNLERILPDPAASGYPPEVLFGAEPEHGWCYYYEKASLARQMEDWNAVERLADEALAKGYLPTTPGSNSAVEWRPFIEGLAASGRLADAAWLTRQAYENDQGAGEMLCSLWKDRLPLQQASNGALALRMVETQLGCK